MDGTIDFHTHFLPKKYAQALKKHIPGDPDGWPTPGWDEHLTLGFMRKNHISYSILSLSSRISILGIRTKPLRCQGC